MNIFGRMGIRGMFLSLLLLVIVPFTCFLFWRSVIDYRVDLSDLYHDARIMGQSIADRLGEILEGKEFPANLRLIDENVVERTVNKAEIPDGAVISVIDAHGKIIGRNPDPRLWIGKKSGVTPGDVKFINMLSRFSEQIGVDGKLRLYKISPVPNSHSKIFVLVGYSKKILIAESRKTLMTSLAFVWGLAWVIFLISWSIGRKIFVEPIMELHATARQLESGDRSARVPRAGNRQIELRELTNAFNSMADTLTADEQKIRQINKDLEKTVEKRTAELNALNEELRARDREREVILKEVHHRIKNNMMTVASLLSIQSQTSDNPSVSNALNTAESRIVSMMVLYDKLYRSRDLTAMPVDAYLSGLIDAITEHFPRKQAVTVQKDLCGTIIDAKRLSAIGILVNELITNAMKYAFVGRETGTITVKATDDSGQMTVSVADDGIGLPDKTAQETTDGFGMELTRLLTVQLTGVLRIESHGGTIVNISFPV